MLCHMLISSSLQCSYVDQRNILVLCVSQDLFTWQIVETILQDDTGLSELDSIRYTGFHCGQACIEELCRDRSLVCRCGLAV